MIEAILPATAVSVETGEDGDEAELFAAEEILVARAVEKRRREFAAGRSCAHRALRRLGLPAAPIGSGRRGEPLWPSGVVGSITHCTGYRACAVAPASKLAAVAIDAEPHAPLPAGLIDDIALAEERAIAAELAHAVPDVHWERLLFSAKETVYKAWYPLAERRLGFEDALIAFEPATRRFCARLLVPGPLVGGSRLQRLDGRWLVTAELALTALAVSR